MSKNVFDAALKNTFVGNQKVNLSYWDIIKGDEK